MRPSGSYNDGPVMTRLHESTTAETSEKSRYGEPADPGPFRSAHQHSAVVDASRKRADSAPMCAYPQAFSH